MVGPLLYRMCEVATLDYFEQPNRIKPYFIIFIIMQSIYRHVSEAK